MAGAALIPDYYKEKMNIAFFLAPPAAMSNNSVTILNIMAIKANRVILKNFVDLIHMWNIIPYNYLASGTASLVCDLFDGKFCNWIMSMFADEDPTIDYTERYDVYMSNLPSGAGYLNYLHYGQLVREKTEVFKRLDYESKKKNKKHYG
mmetsp:Transcript_36316/g.55774  ORF Transcript_36316/g.55774 Transcript_36316/m.55774 type:complete len:149 (+) Transcript_36316:316-762(+)